MQAFMITLLLCSTLMSALALFYMAITPMLSKRYSVTGRYYAWLILVVGLIIPFRPQFGKAVFKIDIPSQTAVTGIHNENGLPVRIHQPAAVNDMIPSAVPNLSWWQIAAAVWVTGMILFLAYHIIRHFRFIKLTVRWSDNITDEQIVSLFQNLKTQMGISGRIGLKACDTIGSPMLTGFVNPYILLPRVNFAEDELYFILKHELTHYKRKDLWYKCLVLAASAIHWFNPVVYLMAKVIDIQCELSCDATVVRSTGMDTRLDYSETIIGVVRYKSKLKTAFSTNFYGGKKGMKKRIYSIMDMSKKKAGVAVLSGALIFTMGTGITFAANPVKEEAQYGETAKTSNTPVTPWIAADFAPNPETYAPYAAFGITVSEDGRKLLYQGNPVRMFVDEQADNWAFYMDDTGSGNWAAVRNGDGKITGIESITAQKAQSYYESFFTDELNSDYPAEEVMETVKDGVNEIDPDTLEKYETYERFGLSYSEADGTMYFQNQRVKFFIDWPAGELPEVLWTDDAGSVNLAAILDASGQITGIEKISDEKAQKYQSEVDEYWESRLDGLEKRIEDKINGAN